MSFIKKNKTKIFVIIFICFTFYAISSILSVDQQAKKEETKISEKETNTIKKKSEKKPETNKVKVDVKGQIVTPGVYELMSTNTVMDAINTAGGLTKLSDTSNINLSKKLSDEMVIIVYSKKEIEEMKETEEVTCPPCNNACITEEDKQAELSNESEKNTENKNTKVNLNTATIEELQTLDGIGETKAQAIIDYRTQNGNFQTIEDLKNVSGIGDSTFEKIKNNITV